MKALFFSLIVSALCLIALAGCKPKNGGGGGNGDAAIHEIRIPLDTDVPTLDPAHMVDITSFAVGSQIFSRLVRFDENVKLQMELAENYTVSSDNLMITFKLKRGVFFHDHPAFGGKPRELDAEDFVYSFTRLIAPETASERGSLLFQVKGAREYFFTRQFPVTARYLISGPFVEEGEPELTLDRLRENIKYVVFSGEADLERLDADLDRNIKENPKAVNPEVKEQLEKLIPLASPPDTVTGLAAPDKYTFTVTLREPFGPFIQMLAMINFAPVPHEVIESMTDRDEFSRKPIGTGPFRLAEWKVDQYILLHPNPQRHKPEPRLSAIRYLVEPDRQTQFQKYLNNELDVANVPTGQYSKIKNDEVLSKELHREDQFVIFFFVLNLTKSPWKDEVFQDKRAIRQAVNYAIDRDYLCDVILEGRYRPFVGLIPPSMKEWTNPEIALRPRYSYNTEMARQLLDQGGHPQGLLLPPIKLSSDRKGDYPAILTEVQGDLRNISVKADLSFMEWATYIDAMENNKLQFFRLGWVYDYPDPDSLIYTLLHSSQRGASGNFAWYRNRDVDKLIEDARRTFDVNKRRALYWQIEQMVLEDAPWIFGFTLTSNVLIKPWVRGVKLSGMDTDASLPNTDMSKVWLDDAAYGGHAAVERPDEAAVDDGASGGDSGEDSIPDSGNADDATGEPAEVADSNEEGRE